MRRTEVHCSRCDAHLGPSSKARATAAHCINSASLKFELRRGAIIAPMKMLFDIFPVVLFFVAFKVFDIYVATAVAMAATVVQIGWVWIRHRKVDNMLWVSLAVIVVFGGATLLLQDETFIKWKPTVLYLAVRGGAGGAGSCSGRT